MEIKSTESIVKSALRNMLLSRVREDIRIGMNQHAIELLDVLLSADSNDSEARELRLLQSKNPMRFDTTVLDQLMDDDVQLLYNRFSEEGLLPAAYSLSETENPKDPVRLRVLLKQLFLIYSESEA